MMFPPIRTDYAQTTHNVTAKRGRNVEHIVLHYTGSTASAENNCKYFSGGNRGASADYFIDKDGTIWQFNAQPTNYYSWHCGDGHGKNGISNANSIGIEVVSAGEEYTPEQISALQQLVPALFEAHGTHSLKRHYDASGKICPAAYCGSKAKDAKWQELTTTILEGDNDMQLTDEVMGANGSIGNVNYVLANLTQRIENIEREVMRTDDPSGRGKDMLDHDHIKWLAKQQADMDAKLDAIISKLA